MADWAIDGHYPLFGLREALSFLAWALVALYAVVRYRYPTQAVGAFTMPLISALTFVALLMGTNPSNTPPSFSATWLFPIHTTLLIFAYAAFFIVFMASVMYLLQERELRLKTFGAIFHRLPALTTINEVATSAAAKAAGMNHPVRIFMLFPPMRRANGHGVDCSTRGLLTHTD